MTPIHLPPAPSVQWRPAEFSGYRTGALDISLAARRIISVPTQLGCRIGCTFCVSGEGPLVRNLTSAEILHLVEEALRTTPPDGRPLELSFTGEGEPALNWRQAAAVCEALPGISSDFGSVRYCFSGLGADRLLGKLSGGSAPDQAAVVPARRAPARARWPGQEQRAARRSSPRSSSTRPGSRASSSTWCCRTA